MKCNSPNGSSCMAYSGGNCLEHLIVDSPICPSRVPITNGDVIISNVKDIDCLVELIWCDSWNEVFNMPDFSSKQELLDWLRKPKELENEI